MALVNASHCLFSVTSATTVLMGATNKTVVSIFRIDRSFCGPFSKTCEQDNAVNGPFFLSPRPSIKLKYVPLLFQFPGLQTPGRCDFETDLCHWQNMTDDKFDWRRHSGNTPSASTGPMYDHTRGFGGGGTFGYCYFRTFHCINNMIIQSNLY